MVKLFLILFVLAILIAAVVVVVVYFKRKKKTESDNAESTDTLKILSKEMEEVNEKLDLANAELGVALVKNEESCEIGEAADTLFTASEKRLGAADNLWDATIKERACLTQEKDSAMFISTVLIPAQVKATKAGDALTTVRMAELRKKKGLVKEVKSLFFELACSGIKRKEAAVYLGLPLVEETEEIQTVKGKTRFGFKKPSIALTGALTAVFIVVCFTIGNFI